MNDSRYLIVNADDFGQSTGVTRGIVEAFKNGIVTSTSAMVRWPAIGDAVKYSREFPKLSVGLHLDLSEWAYRDDEWVCLYQVIDETDATAVRNEVSNQFEGFRMLFGKEPSHIDSHQHAHMNDPLRSIAIELTERIGIPLRQVTEAVSYCGSFYGQSSEGHPNHEAITVDSLIETLRDLPVGITELACHPAFGADIEGMYVSERSLELRTLCDPRVRQAIDELGIHLMSFADIAGISSA